jgi:IMP dehydrogenase
VGGVGVPSTGEETDDMLPMNPEGDEVDDSQVQCGHLLINAHIGQTPVINTEYPEKILGTLEGIIFMEDIIKVLYEYVIKELKTLVSLCDKKSII